MMLRAVRWTERWPAARGGALALVAALLFGASTPLVQRYGQGVGAFTTAALLYLGAAVVGAWMRRAGEREAHLTRSDLLPLLGMAATGAALGPVALAWGLQRTGATSASLMLTLEGVFTAVFAWLFFRETLGRRVALAMLMLLAGGVMLILDQARDSGAQLVGLVAVLAATAAWGLDNTISRSVAVRDPGTVIAAKALLGALATTLIAFAVGEPTPSLSVASALFLVGASGYGLSLRFYLLAQRAFGAARTASVFAFAPFIGAALATLLGDRTGSWSMAASAALMLLGIALHLTEVHGHEHAHEAAEHEHAHEHDDGHHDHQHDPMPVGPHNHRHRHEERRHTHPHVPDVHHTHEH